MAKNNPNAPPPEPQQPSRGPILVLAAGSIAVAALVGWALTRTVEPAAPAIDTAPAPPIAAPQTATNVIPSPPVTAPVTTTTAPAATADDSDGVRRIPPAQLKELVDRGSVTVLDVRDSISYTNGHIPGAINIPFARVQAEASRIPKGKPVVAYCT